VQDPRKVRTGTFVSSNLPRKILIFYKNTISQAECLMLRNIQVKRHERHNSRVISRNVETFIFSEGIKRNFNLYFIFSTLAN